MSRASVNVGLMAVRPAALAPGSGVGFWRYAVRRARRTSRLGLAPRASRVPRIAKKRSIRIAGGGRGQRSGGYPCACKFLDARIAGTQPLQKVPFWDGLVMASLVDQPPCAYGFGLLRLRRRKYTFIGSGPHPTLPTPTGYCSSPPHTVTKHPSGLRPPRAHASRPGIAVVFCDIALTIALRRSGTIHPNLALGSATF